MHENIIEKRHQSPVQRNSRIYIEESYHGTYKILTTANTDENEPPFETMKNLFVLAAFIGYLMEKRVPVKNKVDFAWEALKDEEYAPLLRALALATTEDIEVLANPGSILTIAEEYANAGIELIQKQVENMPGDRVMNLVDVLVN